MINSYWFFFFGLQFKEMGASGISRSGVTAYAAKPAEQQTERKNFFLDWRNLMKPTNEEKDHWVIHLYLQVLPVRVEYQLPRQTRASLFYVIV
jgi:hypothetical protein